MRINRDDTKAASVAAKSTSGCPKNGVAVALSCVQNGEGRQQGLPAVAGLRWGPNPTFPRGWGLSNAATLGNMRAMNKLTLAMVGLAARFARR